MQPEPPHLGSSPTVDAADPKRVEVEPVGQEDGCGREGVGGRAAADRPLPCLNCHNSKEDPLRAAEEWAANTLTPHHKRVAVVLADEVSALARIYGLNRLGFLTLTFAEHVLDKREASRRFNSLATWVLRRRYERAIGVWERQKSGRWHVHLVVVLAEDIRTGVDFAALGQGDYRSAGPALRREWAYWRRTAPAYRFGRTELLPVRSTAEGIARYVGKYIAKHVNHRKPEDRKRRMVTFLGYQQGLKRRSSCQFAWNSAASKMWRWRLAVFAAYWGVETLGQMTQIFGGRWAHRLGRLIMEGQPGDIPVATALAQGRKPQPVAHLVDGRRLADRLAALARVKARKPAGVTLTEADMLEVLQDWQAQLLSNACVESESRGGASELAEPAAMGRPP